MTEDDHLQRRADILAARVEALAEALHAAGVREEASSQLLACASVAVLQALSLELLLERAKSASEPPQRSALDLRLAA